jgi:hypothetical protein
MTLTVPWAWTMADGASDKSIDAARSSALEEAFFELGKAMFTLFYSYALSLNVQASVQVS